jgi:DNA-binding transcriptional regulator YiaG
MIERMTPAKAREHIARLALSQQGFARLIRVNPVTVRRWLNLENPGDMPRAVEILLEVLTPAEVARYLAGDQA